MTETHPSVLPHSFAIRSRRSVAPAVLLAILLFAVYMQVVHFPFSNYDDGEYVQHNPKIAGGFTAAMLRWALTSTEHANWHPVTWVSHALDVQLFGLNPAGHHLTSVVLHALCAILLFLFLVETTGSTLRSLLVAALFALHPVSVESVVWIAERKNVLCTLFFFAGLLSYAWYARRPGVGRYLVVALSKITNMKP